MSRGEAGADTTDDRGLVERAVARFLAGCPVEAAFTEDQAEKTADYLGSIWHVAAASVPSFLATFGDLVAPATRDRLKAIAEAALIQGRLIRQVTGEVAEAFASRGVDLVALKGTASGFAGYADPAQRTGADLDFCVRPHELDISKNIMRQVGFWAGDYDPQEQTFLPSDETERAAREAGHYALGFWVKILDAGEVSPSAAEGFRMAGELLPFASEVTGTRVRTPILVDIHHSLGAGVSASDILDRPRVHHWNGTSVLLPPPEWIAFHALIKLYWEGGQAYGKGFRYLADFCRVLPLMDEEEIDALVGLVEAHNLRPGGYHLLRRMPLCADLDITRLKPVLDVWSRPPANETPSSYNDLGDFWPRLFGHL